MHLLNMNDDAWDNNETKQPSQQQPARLGLGRGKPRFDTNNDAPAPATTWNGGFNSRTSDGFRNNNNNDENHNPNRGGFGRNNSGGYRSNNDGNPRTCFNCNQTGHISRDCPEPRRENNRGGRGGRGGGGFSSRGGFSSSGNSRNQNDNDQYTNNQRTTGGWQSGAHNGNDEGNANGRSTFSNFGSRGSSNNDYGGGFRGSRENGGAGFTSFRDRDNSNGGSNNWPNRNGNQSRDNNGFTSAGRKDRSSDDIFDQPSGRSDAPQRTERYVPPPAPTNEDDIFGAAVEKGENFDKYHRTNVQCTPSGKVKPIELFDEAGLATQILSNIRRAHFEEPTAIQRYTIPCIKQQDDLMACAQTGSGKTGAFLLPIISNLLEYHNDELAERSHPPAPLCLIVSPSRELALQTEAEARKFGYQTGVKPCSAIGGLDMATVSDRLREGCHILSATTGRLKDMVEKGLISLRKVKYFVFDEADRMLDTSFEPDIRKLEELGLPSKSERCTSMFSATFPDEVQKLAKYFLRDDYVFLAVGTPGGANEDITQTIEEVSAADKKGRLVKLLDENLKDQRCLIFVETKRSADYIGTLLSQKKLMSTTMHGDRTQRQRIEAVKQFTNGMCPILVATSVAARGLDFPLIGYVVNYDLPDTSDFYIHRIGRTGRAGHLGKSISFFDPNRDSDRRIAPELIAKLANAGQKVPEFLQKYADGGNSGFSSQAVDMRARGSKFGSRNNQQSFGPSGGSASAGRATAPEEHWDD